jgi:hypothetical protein
MLTLIHRPAEGFQTEQQYRNGEYGNRPHVFPQQSRAITLEQYAPHQLQKMRQRQYAADSLRPFGHAA